MSAVKKQKPKPCYEIDENGKIKLLPLEVPAEFRMKVEVTTSSSSQTKSIHRPRIPLERLEHNLNFLEEPPERSIKKRKVEPSIRKELFKAPTSIPSKLKSRSSIRSYGSLSARKVRQRSSQGVYPLPDILEAEQSFGLSKKSTGSTAFKFNTPAKPVINFIKQNKQAVKFASDSRAKRTSQQPAAMDTSLVTDQEFLELERTCSTPKVAPLTPLSSVCNLLQKTNISGDKAKVKTENRDDYEKAIANLKLIIDEHEKDFRALEARFELFKKNYEVRAKQLIETLEELENLAAQNKENIPSRRSSGRLAQKLSKANEENKSKLLTSPAILKSIDLRKQTLTRNLTKNIQAGAQTPRTSKAIHMYNSMRNEFGILCKPKVVVNDGSPKVDVETFSLSKKLQKQCLLLQQTPSRK